MRWPWVSRGLYEAALVEADRWSRESDIMERAGREAARLLAEQIATERQRLTDAYATINALKLAGGAAPPTALEVPVADPVKAAIFERAMQYPMRTRQQLIRTMSESAMLKRGAGVDDAEIVHAIMNGQPVDDGVPA